MDTRDKMVGQGIEDLMGWMEDKDLRVQQEEMEQKANQVHRDHPELKERLEKLDLQEAWVRLDLRVLPVHRVLEEGLEKLEQKDHQVQLVLVDLQERMEIREWEAQQVHPAWMGTQDYMDHRDRWVLQENKV